MAYTYTRRRAEPTVGRYLSSAARYRAQFVPNTQIPTPSLMVNPATCRPDASQPCYSVAKAMKRIASKTGQSRQNWTRCTCVSSEQTGQSNLCFPPRNINVLWSQAATTESTTCEQNSRGKQRKQKKMFGKKTKPRQTINKGKKIHEETEQ